MYIMQKIKYKFYNASISIIVLQYLLNQLRYYALIIEIMTFGNAEIDFITT